MFNRLHITSAADASYNELVSKCFGEMSMLVLCGGIPVTKTFKSAGRLSQNFDNNYDIGCCSDIKILSHKFKQPQHEVCLRFCD